MATKIYKHKSRSKKYCKYGRLKVPVKTRSGRKRRCSKKRKSKKRKTKKRKTKKRKRKSKKRKSKRKTKRSNRKKYRMKSLASLSSRKVIYQLKGGIDERLDSVDKLNIPSLTKELIRTELLSDREKIDDFVDAKSQQDKDIVINWYIYSNQIDKIRTVLKYYPEYVNAQDEEIMQTGLMYAINDGHTDIARLLIENGANVNIQNDDGYTALMYATMMNNIDIVKLLLENGANVNIQNNRGSTALELAYSYNRENIAKLLIENGSKNKDYNTSSKVSYL